MTRPAPPTVGPAFAEVAADIGLCSLNRVCNIFTSAGPDGLSHPTRSEGRP